MDMKKSEKRRVMYFVVACVFFIVFLCGVLYIFNYYSKQKNAQEQYVEIKEDTEVDSQIKETLPEETVFEESLTWRKDRKINFTELWKTNEDIYSWIEIPGTQVDYPVLQHPTDDVYYLDHTVDHVKGLPGSIYSEGIHPKDFSAKNTVLYGHNMKNDSMFGSLHNYEDEEFFKNHPYVYIYLPKCTLVYKIFAAVKFSDVYLPTYCEYDNFDEFFKYIEEIKMSQGNINEDVVFSEDSKILTMSTCVANQPKNRFLVEAVLIDEYEN